MARANERNVAVSEHVPTERHIFNSRKRALDINQMATEHHEHGIKHVTGDTSFGASHPQETTP
eukprot:CAMPEP_0172592616 /NCGR_PEP_ID=MMETSP1068-20121228/11636_1 /TAXON_ID=35684 /ORGANISM="Pseudopedinella elastica, Strain CCMP716" /LENGTH=62 /DNA_ID=CAMNT_0013389699 /DNA_START=32 /DNA_END=217 /DNA_ORIENTATION=-